MYLQIDTWAYSLIQIHTHPDAWGVSPVVSHGLTVTLFRADLGAVLTPPENLFPEYLLKLLREGQTVRVQSGFLKSPGSPQNFHV